VKTTSSRKAALVALVLGSAILVSCGDYYRPTAIPIVKPGGDPAFFEGAVVLTANPTGGSGGTVGQAGLMNIDMSGEVNVGNHFVGRGAVQAASLRGAVNTTYTANQVDSTVSVAGFGASANVSNVTLLPGSVPTSIGTSRLDTMYVTMTGNNSYSDENCPGSGLLGVVRGLVLEAHVCVGANPVGIVGSVDQNRIYVLNNGSDSVTVVDAASRTVVDTVALPAGSGPVKGIVHPTRPMLYVLNSNGTISVINTIYLTVASTFSSGGTSPVDIFYDSRNSRLVVLNEGNSSVRVFQVPVDLPTSNRDVTVGAAPKSLVVLPNGAKAYVANSGEDTISVIDLTTFAEKKITLTDTTASPSPHTPVSISAARDSSRVIVANSGSRDVSIIRTSTDTEVPDLQGAPYRLPAPYQDPHCVPTASVPCGRQSPVQVLTVIKTQ
jgi:YVTN family beta-propeller protein